LIGRERFLLTNGSKRGRRVRGRGGARNSHFEGQRDTPKDTTVFKTPNETCGSLPQENSKEELKVGNFCDSSVYSRIHQWI